MARPCNQLLSNGNVAVSCLFPGQGCSQGGPGVSSSRRRPEDPENPSKPMGNLYRFVPEASWPRKFSYGPILATEQMRNCHMALYEYGDHPTKVHFPRQAIQILDKKRVLGAWRHVDGTSRILFPIRFPQILRLGIACFNIMHFGGGSSF